MNPRHALIAKLRARHLGRAILIPLLGVAFALTVARPSSADDEPKTTAARATTTELGDSDQVLKDGVKRYIAKLREEGAQLVKELGPEHAKVLAKKKQLQEAQRLLEQIATQGAKQPATAVPESLTTPAEDYSWLDFRLSSAAERDEAKVAEMQARAEKFAAQLQIRDQQLAMASQQLKAMEADREMAPIEGAQTRVFKLAYTPSADAAKKVLSLFGPRTLRVSIDERSNSLIVFGKADQMEQVSQLLQALDAPSEEGSADVDPNAPAAKGDEVRSVLLRVFWLADGLPEGEGEPPANYLPGPVLEAMDRLGLDGPRLVAQTVNSLATGKGGAVNFATHVPALLFKQPAQLSCTGEMAPVTGDRTRLQVQIQITGHVGCDLSGSLVTPLGHYMVLGTANSIAGGPQPTVPAGMGMEGGYGGEFGRGYGRGEFGGRGGEMDAAMAGEGAAPPSETTEPKYETSRFAFVVQVTDGESYAPEGEKERPKR